MLSGNVFVRGANPKWYFNTIAGVSIQPPACISFLSNVFPYLPQNVFQDPQGRVIWGQPIPFDQSGSIPDNIYFDQTLVYRIEIRADQTQTSPLLVPPIENYIPGDEQNPDDLPTSNTDNQITNPQFYFSNVVNTATVTTAGTYNVAPGWYLTLVGSGSTVITHNAYAGNQNLTGNPPYTMQFANGGWTSATLFQKFKNGALFANSAISFSMLIRSITNMQEIAVNYQDDSGNPAIPIIGNTEVGFDFETVAGAIPLGESTNTVLPPTAYVELQIVLPPNGDVELTNVMMFGAEEPITIDFQETTTERQEDQLFNVYREQLVIKPKASILTGWDFGINPFQFNSPGQTTIPATCQYICDQTILYCKSGGNNIQVFRNINETTGLQLNPVTGAGAGATQFALINYTPSQTMAAFWGQFVSSLVRARIYSPTGTQVRFKMRLLYRQSQPPVIGAAEPILSWTGVEPTFASGWTEIIPPFDPIFTFQNSYLIGEGQTAFPSYNFDGMILPGQVTQNDTLAIVIYTLDSMNATSGSQDVIDFQRVSLVPNRFAVDSNPLSFDENLRKCQYFYEKSYPWNEYPQTATINTHGELTHNLFMFQNASTMNWELFLTSFGFPFKQTKRVAPTGVNFNFYSPATGHIDNLDAYIYQNGAATTLTTVGGTSTYPIVSVSQDAIDFLCNSTTSVVATGNNMTGQEGLLRFQYTADARLGIV